MKFRNQKEIKFNEINQFKNEDIEELKCFHQQSDNRTNSTQNSINLSIQEKSKSKYFKIKKFLNYDKIVNGIVNNKITKMKKINDKRRIHYISIKHTGKLSDSQKIDKMKLLSKVIRRYRRKYNILKSKFRQNIEKLFIQTFNKKINPLMKKEKSKYSQLTLTKLINVLKKLKENTGVEYEDDKFIIENLVNQINSNKDFLESLTFKVICTQIRIFLESSQVNHISVSQPKIHINLPQKKVFISEKELNLYRSLGNDIQAFNVVFGLSKGGEKRKPNLDKFQFFMNKVEQENDLNDEMLIQNSKEFELFNSIDEKFNFVENFDIYK